MAQHFVIPRRRSPGFNAGVYGALITPVGELLLDEALFVTRDGSSTAETDLRSAVSTLRAGLKTRFGSKGVVLVEDFAKGGVWIYRPTSKGPGNGRAIGTDKEEEIRRRPLKMAAAT
jgi:hypothetical protein